MAWSFAVVKKLGVRAAGFCPSSAAMFATRIRIPKRCGAFQLAPGVSHLDAAEISWNRAGDPAGQPFIFRLILRNNAATHLAETILCNTLRELEAGAFAVFPGVVPVGPLSSGDNPAGSFWPQDASCAAWLDAQPARSVVYVAFGSIASFDAAQLVELAEGLALTARPFLWVVRPGSAGQHQLLGRLAAASRGRVERDKVEDGAGGRRQWDGARGAGQGGGAPRRRGVEGEGTRAAGPRSARTGHRVAT
jgi:hypothetical protein